VVVTVAVVVGTWWVCLLGFWFVLVRDDGVEKGRGKRKGWCDFEGGYMFLADSRRIEIT
jgi:hypothetical protein